MTSLLDIAPPEVACKEIPIDRPDGRKVLRVTGLTALDIAKLIKRFPKFRLSAAGKKLSEDDLMDIGLDTAPAIIAMGLRSYDDETEKLVQTNLTIEEQTELLEAIISLTNPEMPKKNGPFKAARAGRGGATASGRDQDGISP